MPLAKEIAQILLQKNAVKISTNPPFTWTSGIISPVYCDNRRLIGFPKERQRVLEGFKKLIQQNGLEFDVLGGTATAAIPWAAFLAQELQKPMVYIRPKPKEHGAGKQVEGFMEQCSRVLIVEDLFSTGGSSIRSAEACKKEFNAQIVGAIAIVTYGFQKTKENFDSAKIPFFSLTNFETIVNELRVSDDEKALVLDFARDPENWGKHR